jgi:hypothetical protein
MLLVSLPCCAGAFTVSSAKVSFMLISARDMSLDIYKACIVDEYPYLACSRSHGVGNPEAMLSGALAARFSFSWAIS